jgi:hypothetical protein
MRKYLFVKDLENSLAIFKAKHRALKRPKRYLKGIFFHGLKAAARGLK